MKQLDVYATSDFYDTLELPLDAPKAAIATAVAAVGALQVPNRVETIEVLAALGSDVSARAGRWSRGMSFVGDLYVRELFDDVLDLTEVDVAIVAADLGTLRKSIREPPICWTEAKAREQLVRDDLATLIALSLEAAISDVADILFRTLTTSGVPSGGRGSDTGSTSRGSRKRTE